MKKVLMILIILLLTLTYPVQALTIDPKVSLDTGNVDLLLGVKTRVVYEASVSVSKPSSAQPGETTKWNIQLSGGTLSVSIYVPSPVNKWYTASKFVPIGSYVNIPVTTGVTAGIRVLSSASLSVSGPGSLDTSSLSWESEGTKPVTVNVRSDAKLGEKVTVNMSFKFPIYVNVFIDLLLFKREIASTNVGTFTASPTLSESMSIGALPSIPIPPYVVMLIIVLVIIVIGYAIYSHRKISKTHQSYSTYVERSKGEKEVSELDEETRIMFLENPTSGSCGICKEEWFIDSQVYRCSECGTNFHFDCIQEYLNKSHRCPKCQRRAMLSLN